MINAPVLMSHIPAPIYRRPKLVTAALLGYLAVVGGYMMLVRHESAVWQANRQKLIEQSPVVWVAPYGVRYHQEWHYGRHLSSPISLYEATERGYEYCNVCHPPPPAKPLVAPAWARHWVGGLAALSCLWLILSAGMLYKARRGA
jgi:hypothetical protein